MDDLKSFKRIFLAILAGALLGVLPARAVVIEGFDGTGEFRTVGVSADGALHVQGSSSVAQAIFFVSSQPVNAYQAGAWTVSLSSGISVSVTSIANVTLSSCATVAQTKLSYGPPTTLIYSANQTRCGSMVCNTDVNLNAWVGGATVNTGNGTLLLPGACFSPDTPFRFTGALYAASTAAVALSLLEFTP